MKEVDIIDALKGSIHQSQADVSLSIGDDGAIIDLDHTKQMVTVTDAISVDVHYPAGIEAEAIGYRSLAVNLSDIAAMGGIPIAYNLSLTIPRANSTWMSVFKKGLQKISKEYQIVLTGGDLC